MFNRNVTSVSQALASLPAESRVPLTAVYEAVRRHMPEGYVEAMNWGAINWAVPLERLPDTYNGQPLTYVALAAGKASHSLYLMAAYADPKQRAGLEAAFKRAGKKLDMGKSCVHFTRAEDLPLEAIGKLIAAIPPQKWIDAYRASRAAPVARGGAKKPGARAAPRRRKKGRTGTR